MTAAPFTDAEFAARLGRVQAVMAERSLAALVVADPANLYYLTGYNAWSFYTPQCLVVPAAGLPHLFARAMDAQGAHYTANLGRDHIHGYPEAPRAPPRRAPLRLDRRPRPWSSAWSRTPPGWTSPPRPTRTSSPRAASWPCGATSATRPWWTRRELVNWVRAVKSPAEQEKMRAAGAIAERVMATALDAVTPGRRQCDVVAEIQHAQALRHPDAGRGLPRGGAHAADRRDGRHPAPDVERRARSSRARPPRSSSPASTTATTRRWPARSVSARRPGGSPSCADAVIEGHGGGAGGAASRRAPATTCTRRSPRSSAGTA